MQMTTVRDSTGSSGAQCRPTHGSPRGQGHARCIQVPSVYRSLASVQQGGLGSFLSFLSPGHSPPQCRKAVSLGLGPHITQAFISCAVVTVALTSPSSSWTCST